MALIRAWPFVRALKSVWGWSVDTSCNTPPVAPGCQAVEHLEQCWGFFLPRCCSVDSFKLELKGWRSPGERLVSGRPSCAARPPPRAPAAREPEKAGKFRQQSNFGRLQWCARAPLSHGTLQWQLGHPVLVAVSPRRQDGHGVTGAELAADEEGAGGEQRPKKARPNLPLPELEVKISIPGSCGAFFQAVDSPV